MKIEIKSWMTGKVLFSCEATSMKIAVGLAIKANANLGGADLGCADLSRANLRGANLVGADLRSADLSRANLSRANLGGANLSRANLVGANLSRADLRSANLGGANLSRANLDYSCWPLWCGSKKVKVDVKIAAQIAAHFCVLDCNDKEYIKAKEAILGFAKTSHRAGDLNLLEEHK